MIREGYYRAGEGYRSTDERGYNAGLIIARDFDGQMLYTTQADAGYLL